MSSYSVQSKVTQATEEIIQNCSNVEKLRFESGATSYKFVKQYGKVDFFVTMVMYLLFSVMNIVITYILGKSEIFKIGDLIFYFAITFSLAVLFLVLRSVIYSKAIAKMGFKMNHKLSKSTLLRNCAFFNATP